MLKLSCIAIFVLLFCRNAACLNMGEASKRHVTVWMPHVDIWRSSIETVEIFCDYRISTGEDLPVTVTWKIGEGPILAEPILRCQGYTHGEKKCSSIAMLDPNYYFRANFASDSPSLILYSPLTVADAQSYSCEVAVENPTNYELEYDLKSAVLYISDIGQYPYKLNHVILTANSIVSGPGGSSTLECLCRTPQYAGGNYCDNLNWYKGPSSDGQFELIYSRHLPEDSGLAEHTVHGRWSGRVSLIDDSLQINNFLEEDEGRYWCEFKAEATSLKFIATDAKSVVLDLNPED